MSFFSDLLKGGTEGFFSGLGTFAKDIRAAITGQTVLDPNKQAELLEKLAALEASAEQARINFDTVQMQGQNAINQLEAQSGNLFVSGWRPAVGWICVSGMGYTFIVKPLLPWFITVGCLVFKTTSAIPPLPEVPMGDLIVLLTGMLGLGALRSYDKMKNGAKR